MPAALSFVSAVDGTAVTEPAVQLTDGNGYSRDAKAFSGTLLPVPSIWHSAAVRATPAVPGFERESTTLVNLPKMAALAPPVHRLFLLPTPRTADEFGRPLPAAREQPLHVMLRWGTPDRVPPPRPSDLEAPSLHCITSKGEHISAQNPVSTDRSIKFTTDPLVTRGMDTIRLLPSNGMRYRFYAVRGDDSVDLCFSNAVLKVFGLAEPAEVGVSRRFTPGTRYWDGFTLDGGSNQMDIANVMRDDEPERPRLY